MIKLEFSKIASDKIRKNKSDLTLKYGDFFAKKSIKETLRKLRRLEQFPMSGVQIARMYDIGTDYWYVFVNHNYYVYRIENDKVMIVQVFSEKEDFINSLFGISGRTQESIDFWGE